jgi:heme/copper-type cytochrome/quinol oxidase subunit 2
MESIVYFHDDMMFYLIAITIFVLFMLLRTVYIFHVPNNPNKEKMIRGNWEFYNRLTHHVGLEVAWTIVPTVLLCNIMSASFALLYSLEQLDNPEVTVKVIGHQWYWSYELNTKENVGVEREIEPSFGFNETQKCLIKRGLYEVESQTLDINPAKELKDFEM